jgi:creatinine amidohydrolase/Fe(II)-dependent formamide hydrolase-like protein
MKKLLFIPLLLCLSSNAFAQNKGVLLENLTWQEAEKALKQESVVVIPLGAAAKEHDPHLKMLYMEPASVDMRKAVKDYQPLPEGSARVRFTRDPQAAARGGGIYSPTGSWGDPTLATREKGRKVTEATLAHILKQIETLRQATPPNTGAAK